MHEAGSFDQQLATLTDEARRADAAQSRLRHADRALALSLSGTFAGTLTEIAETRTAVSLMCRTGNAIRGTIAELGPDIVVILASGKQTLVLVRHDAIEAIVEHGNPHSRDVAAITSGPTLAELLDTYSYDNERIAVTLSTGNKLMGTVRAVGVDQLVLRLDGDGDTVTVPLRAIDQVAVSP